MRRFEVCVYSGLRILTKQIHYLNFLFPTFSGNGTSVQYCTRVHVEIPALPKLLCTTASGG